MVIYCQTTGVSAAHATHCATYCNPCRPLLRAFSGWIRTPTLQAGNWTRSRLTPPELPVTCTPKYRTDCNPPVPQTLSLSHTRSLYLSLSLSLFLFLPLFDSFSLSQHESWTQVSGPSCPTTWCPLLRPLLRRSATARCALHPTQRNPNLVDRRLINPTPSNLTHTPTNCLSRAHAHSRPHL